MLPHKWLVFHVIVAREQAINKFDRLSAILYVSIEFNSIWALFQESCCGGEFLHKYLKVMLEIKLIKSHAR